MGSEFIFQANAEHLPLADDSVDLVITSPPYCDARLYLESGKDRNISRGCADWIDWMLKVVAEMVRVSRGLVIVNCAGVTRDYVYQPGPEGLLYEWWKLGGRCWRPAYMHRVGVPGSGGAEWFRSDIEHLLCFTKSVPGESPMRSVKSVETVTNKRGHERFRHLLDCGHYCTRGKISDALKCGRCVRCLPWSDNTACGHPPKYGPGGKMSNRLSDGGRVNQWGRVGSVKGMGAKRRDGVFGNRQRPSHRVSAFGMATDRAVGTRKSGAKSDLEIYRPRVVQTIPRDGMHNQDQHYRVPVMANPGNVLKVIVGGGAMGSKLSHENEAPFAEALPAFFIKSFCPRGGIVLDCFGGSGTTAAAARSLGRRAISCDIRMSQCDLMRRRLAEPVKVPKIKARRKVGPSPQSQGDLFAEAG